MNRFAGLLVVLLVIAVVPSMYAQPVAAQEPGGGGMQRAFFEVDYFTYRAAFELADGTEAVVLRSSYKVNFLYQHHHPTLNEHYISVTMGFYFGKTMLGRPLVQNMTFDEIAFYPKWRNSAGYYHDYLNVLPVFSTSGAMADGKMFGGFLLIDNDALSQYIPMFGGYIVFDGLRITLIDGSVIDYSDSTFMIELEKRSNDVLPQNATLTGNDIDYTSDDGYIHINTMGAAQPVVLIDLILGIAILSTASLVVVLGVLHVKGRITLPISRLKGAFRHESTPPPNM
ncbi:MAG: hypothetical protein ACFFED_02045 [Candidatus Thorarchaeota archaeon]